MMVDGEIVEDDDGVKDEDDDIKDDDVEYHDQQIDEDAMDVEGLEDEFVDMSYTSFSLHTGSVFCVDMAPSEKYAMSGGEDDLAYVWDVHNPDEGAHKIDGHKDSVIHVGFSSNEKYYFSADMSGYIQLFELENHHKIWDFEVGDIQWVRWHPLVPILLAGSEDGAVWMWKIPSFETKTIQLSSSPAVAAQLLSTNRHLVVGYQDGVVKLVDLKVGEATISVETKLQITCIGVSADDKMILVGGMSSRIVLIAVQSGKIIARLSERPPAQGPNPPPDVNSVEAIKFHPTRTLVAVAYVENRVCVWDTALQKLRTTLPHPEGVITCAWAGDSAHHLVTACLDGVVRVWDVDQTEMISEATGHTSNLLDMKISEHFVVTSSDDGSAKVFITS